MNADRPLTLKFVIPAQAGVQLIKRARAAVNTGILSASRAVYYCWISACAGMTESGSNINFGFNPTHPLLCSEKTKTKSAQLGFTLIEVLVALAILAITMAAVSRTASSSTRHADAMRTRIMADWVAQNRLALHQARGDWLPAGIVSGEEAQGAFTFTWQEEVTTTPNPTMRRIIVSVYAPDDKSQVLREITGYLVQFPR